jgi:hypothetical protein
VTEGKKQTSGDTKNKGPGRQLRMRLLDWTAEASPAVMCRDPKAAATVTPSGSAAGPLVSVYSSNVHGTNQSNHRTNNGNRGESTAGRGRQKGKGEENIVKDVTFP